jgi:hypothetical protein
MPASPAPPVSFLRRTIHRSVVARLRASCRSGACPFLPGMRGDAEGGMSRVDAIDNKNGRCDRRDRVSAKAPPKFDRLCGLPACLQNARLGMSPSRAERGTRWRILSRTHAPGPTLGHCAFGLRTRTAFLSIRKLQACSMPTANPGKSLEKKVKAKEPLREISQIAKSRDALRGTTKNRES